MYSQTVSVLAINFPNLHGAKMAGLGDKLKGRVSSVLMAPSNAIVSFDND